MERRFQIKPDGEPYSKNENHGEPRLNQLKMEQDDPLKTAETIIP